MRYISIVIASSVTIVVTTILAFKLGMLDTVHSHLGQLCLWSLTAIILSKTIMKRKTVYSRSLLSFREMVIILGILFATMCANAGVQSLQMKIFGYTYTSASEDPAPKDLPGETYTPPTVTEKISKTLLSVTSEEIPSRWITLGALLMLMPWGWALLISSALFSLQHIIVPISAGMPEIGFFRLAPTFMIGIGCGIAFMRSGLPAAILVHLLVNLVVVFSDNHTYIADSIIFGSAFVAILVLPLTLWFTRKQHARHLLARPIRSI